MLDWVRKSITAQFIVPLISLILVVLAAGVLLGVRARWTEGVAALQERVNVLTKVTAGGLVEPTWSLDYKNIATQLHPLALDPLFAGARVTDDMRVIRASEGTLPAPGTAGILMASSRIVKDNNYIGELTIAVSLASVEANVKRFAIWSAAIAIAMALAVALILALLTYRITGPISALTSTMRKLAAGKLNTPIPALERGDEIGSIAHSVEVFRQALVEAEQLRDGEDRVKAQVLSRLNRELLAIRDCNQTLIRAEDERALLCDICRIVCDKAGYRLAWVGYAENDEDKTVRPVAWAGAGADILDNANITWADTERGRGPAGTAIRSGKTSYIMDLTADAGMAPWREGTISRGYRSCIALSLKDETGSTFGALSIYSAETGAFTPEEIALLEELAGDLAFGVAVLRVRKEHKRAEADLRQLNQELEQRVAGRTAALEQANKELESFSYSVSHDLRAPLRAIDGFSRILQEEYGSILGEEGRRYTQTIGRNAVRMGQLIDDILDFSRMSRREIAMTPVDMTELAQEVYEEVRGAAPAERNIVLHMAGLPPARGDRATLRQVWVNLLSNAIKYTGPRADAVIEVGSSAAGGENTYWVKDNGVGFDMQFADKLFGVFQRLHTGEEFEGTGIGLAIVKRIVTRHGGRVWAESELGKGTALFFTLPAREGEQDQARCGSQTSASPMT